MEYMGLKPTLSFHEPGSFGACDDCGMMKGGSSNGPLCNCSGLAGDVTVNGPTDLVVLLAKGRFLTFEVIRKATEDSLRKAHKLSSGAVHPDSKLTPEVYHKIIANDPFPGPGARREWATLARVLLEELERRGLGPSAEEQGKRRLRAERDEHLRSAIQALEMSRPLGPTASRDVAMAIRETLLELADLRAAEAEGTRSYDALRSSFASVSEENLRLVKERDRLENELEQERYNHQRLREAPASTAELRWKSSRGRLLLPREFKNGHLINTLNLIERKYVASERVRQGHPMPEGFRYVQDDQFERDGVGEDWSPPVSEMSPIYPHLLAEARLRGLVFDQARPELEKEEPGEPDSRPRATVRVSGTRTSVHPEDDDSSIYAVCLAPEMDVSERFYWQVQDEIRLYGHSFLEVHVNPETRAVPKVSTNGSKDWTEQVDLGPDFE